MAGLSKEDMVKEILKCGKDPVYFINNFCRISHPMEGLIPFRTYDFQEDLLNDFNGHRFNVILKARQMGIQQPIRVERRRIRDEKKIRVVPPRTPGLTQASP